MQTNQRLRKLEESVGLDGGLCRHGVAVHWPNESIICDLICPECGRERPIVQVVYDGEVGAKHETMPTGHHVTEGQVVAYNSTPATSGDHWPKWSKCGFFEEPLPDERIVHNLEHSNIVVSYNLTTPEEVVADYNIAMAQMWKMRQHGSLSRF